MGKIIDAIQESGFAINKLKMSKFNAQSVTKFYEEHKNKDFFANLKLFMTSDVTVGMELVAADAV